VSNNCTFRPITYGDQTSSSTTSKLKHLDMYLFKNCVATFDFMIAYTKHFTDLEMPGDKKLPKISESDFGTSKVH